MHGLIISLCIFSFLNFYATAQYEGAICRTPNNELAYCLSLTNCPVLYQSLSNRKDESQKLFLRNSICGIQATQWGMSNLVCCGSMSNYIKRLETPARKPTPKPESTNSSQDFRANLEKLLPSRGVCGESDYADRILGGSEAGIGEYPWMVQLFFRRTGSGEVIPASLCGGSLISKRYVITAAHCLVNSDRQIYSVRLGEHDVTKEIDCYGEQGCNEKVQDVLVENAVVNKGYFARGNERNFQDDIALIRLIKNIDFTEFITPICLPINGETAKIGQKLMTAGWGSLNAAGTQLSPIKMKLRVTIRNHSECSDRYRRRLNTILSNKQICAGGEAGKDACQGDSGGPLMTRIPGTTRWYLEGIVSFGPEKCGIEGVPGVYTKVSAYLDWISRNMKP